MTKEMLSKAYDPSQVEDRLYKAWDDAGAFAAREEDPRPAYTIVIPPPNVTGMLTMGHVLNNTLQDILIRHQRMLGRNTLWLPGTDHAGIATQNVVEKFLSKEEKTTRHVLGREKFLEKVWAWKEKYGGIIIQQLKRLGCSCDWKRERFTMDEGLSKAVQEVFIRLHQDGLIYKGQYIVNWCPRCQTALSDEEKIPTDTQGKLWHIRYPRVDGQGHVTVATTRPETMLGDTAVAVNPNDERYRDLVGKLLKLPRTNREIPVIADPFVDPAFGTGCVKVTPAHDPNDFEMGNRHNLPRVVVMAENGKMNENAGADYAGMDRFKCREKLVADLEADGLLDKIDPHQLAVGHCERCNTVIEPYLSEQWFVKMKPLAEAAIKAVKDGTLRFYPERWVGVYLNWMENIRDWCISRQLWWGHRIPAFTCNECKAVEVAREAPDKCKKCGSTRGFTQDEDVLDTWFSSWLWPFSTMGWPDDTATLRKFYPTQSLVTGPDIIFFWVARMVMAGYHFMGKCPFTDVYFTSIVRDMQGRKMSKSLGNSPDPLELIKTYGADALRFTTIWLAPVGQDIRFAAELCEQGKHFANKIWNASRFVLMNLGDTEPAPLSASTKLSVWDRFILSRLQKIGAQVREHLAAYRFNDALKAIYEFMWNELCDLYIEMSKPALYGSDEEAKAAARSTLVHVLDHGLRILHPFMPFITDEIWQKLPGTKGLLMQAPYPAQDAAFVNLPLEQEMDAFLEGIRVIRNLRASANVAPAKKVTVHVAHGKAGEALFQNPAMVGTLAGVEKLLVAQGKPQGALVGLFGDTEVYLDLAGLIDVEAETQRLGKEREKLEKECERLNAKLGNQSFVGKAPAAVVDKVREDLAAAKLQLEKLLTHINELGSAKKG